MNFGHSGTPGFEKDYEDKSGMMGYSYNQFTYPKMCYNA